MMSFLTRGSRRSEVRALASLSRTGLRPSVTLVGGVCLNFARGSEGPVYQCRSRADPESAVCHCFPGGGLGNLGAQCAGIRHRLETEHEKLAAVVGGANTRVNWGLDYLKFFLRGTGIRFLTLGSPHRGASPRESFLFWSSKDRSSVDLSFFPQVSDEHMMGVSSRAAIYNCGDPSFFGKLTSL